MRGGGIEQGLQMYLHLIIAAGLEDRAALRQRFEQNGRVRPKRGDEAELTNRHDLSKSITKNLSSGVRKAIFRLCGPPRPLR